MMLNGIRILAHNGTRLKIKILRTSLITRTTKAAERPASSSKRPEAISAYKYRAIHTVHTVATSANDVTSGSIGLVEITVSLVTAGKNLKVGTPHKPN